MWSPGIINQCEYFEVNGLLVRRVNSDQKFHASKFCKIICHHTSTEKLGFPTSENDGLGDRCSKFSKSSPHCSVGLTLILVTLS